MRVLVIGGTGMIGTAVSRQLLDRGDEVSIYTRGQTEVRLSPDSPNPATAGNSNEPTFITGNRQDHAAFEAQLLALPPFDAVIDMVAFRAEDAASVIRVCRGRTKRIVFCSTASVYAWPATRYPVTEAEPLNPGEPYGINKVACKSLLLDAHARGDVSATILRLAHTFGEGRAMLHPLGNRSAFISRLRAGKPIVVHGDGSSLWAACHVEDVARAFVAACNSDFAAGHAYNIAGTEWLTWNRYVQLCAEAAAARRRRSSTSPRTFSAASPPKPPGAPSLAISSPKSSTSPLPAPPSASSKLSHSSRLPAASSLG